MQYTNIQWKTSSGWWLNQPIWKICSSNWIISPRDRGENKKIFEVSPPSYRLDLLKMVEKMKNIIPNGGLMVFVCSHLPPNRLQNLQGTSRLRKHLQWTSYRKPQPKRVASRRKLSPCSMNSFVFSGRFFNAFDIICVKSYLHGAVSGWYKVEANHFIHC